jgi:hypothetical protein
LILSMLRRWFLVQPAAQADVVAAGLLGRVILPSSGGSWDIAPLPGLPHLALLPRERGASWRSLDVAAIEGVLESLLGPGAVSRDATIVAEVDAGQAARVVHEGSAQAAFLLPMPNVNRLLAVAEEGDLLPPKSTWFDPKAPAGLVINDLAR